MGRKLTFEEHVGPKNERELKAALHRVERAQDKGHSGYKAKEQKARGGSLRRKKARYRRRLDGRDPYFNTMTKRGKRGGVPGHLQSEYEQRKIVQTILEEVE